MKAKLRLLFFVAFMWLVGSTEHSGAANQASASPHSEILFNGTTNILFSQLVVLEPRRFFWEPERFSDYTTVTNKFSVTNTGAVKRLIFEIKLKPKGGPCECLHWREALFLGPKGPVRVEFCDHCFDVYMGKRICGFYFMPKGFYAEFQRLAQQQNWGYVDAP